VAHCVEIVMKCLNVLYVNPSPFYYIKMLYACESVVLKMDVSCVSKQ